MRTTTNKKMQIAQWFGFSEKLTLQQELTDGEQLILTNASKFGVYLNDTTVCLNTFGAGNHLPQVSPETFDNELTARRMEFTIEGDPFHYTQLEDYTEI